MPKSSKRDGAMSKTPKTGGQVYAGGSPNFDENKGRYIAPPRGSERLSPGVYRTPSGELMTGQGRILPRQEQQLGQRLAESMIPGRPDIATRPPAPNEYVPMMPGYNPAGPYTTYPARMDPSQVASFNVAMQQLQQMQSSQQPPSLSQVSRMSGPEIQALAAQRQQAQMMNQQGGSPNSGPGSFPMQQRERELGYAENRFDAARNNNLFKGNPVRRFKF